MKKCTICFVMKPYSEFHKEASRKDGHCSWCKPCKSLKKAADYQANAHKIKARVAKHRKANPEKVRDAKKRCYQAKRDEYLARNKSYYEANKEACIAATNKWRKENRSRYVDNTRKYYQANREKRIAEQSAYYKDNREKRLQYHAAYEKRRRKADPLYALSRVVRRRISIVLKERGFSKTSRTREMLGCDYETLRAHLEFLFKPGMTWENRGQWHIDHKTPLASAKTEEELLALCHYTNLQPLWAADNLSKGAKMPGNLA